MPHPRLPERPVLRRRHHQIHDAARGKPRAVNNLAIAALIATYAATKKIVDQSAARAASARSSQQNEHPADTLNTKPRPAPPGGASAVAHTLTANDAATLTLSPRNTFGAR